MRARLENLVKSWINAWTDDDECSDEAWQELEEYLRGEPASPLRATRTTRREGTGAQATTDAAAVEIRQAFFDLDLEPGASAEQVRSAYRRLLLKYHPDRFNGDADRTRIASEIIQRVSLAYKQLNGYYQ